jgi:hypothetical protein
MQLDLDEICMVIRNLQVDRKFVLNVESKLRNTTAARICSAIGLPDNAAKDADEVAKKRVETARDKVWSQALGIVRTEILIGQQKNAATLAAFKGEKVRKSKPKEHKEEDQDIVALQERNLQMVTMMALPLLSRREELETEMARLAGLLPTAGWWAEIPGCDLLGLAVIVGEAGNLANYRGTKGYRKLWRRLGFGMAPGHEQHAYSTWRRLKGKGALTAEDWIKAGYAPRRLGQIYGVVTVPLFMKKAESIYGEVYDARRRHTMESHPEWWVDAKGKPKVNPKTGEPSSAHAMEDAKRIMTKELLADLWRVWRGSNNPVEELECDWSAPQLQELSLA